MDYDLLILKFFWVFFIIIFLANYGIIICNQGSDKMVTMYEVRDSKDKNIYSLDEMIEMYDHDEVNYSYVSKRLECPSCGAKNIKINITDNMSVIRSDRDSHDPSCDYYGIKLKQSFIKKELKKQNHFINEFNDIYNNNFNGDKRLPKKSIERKLTEDDYDVIKVFYGKVSVKNAHSKDVSRYINFSLKAPKGDIINLTITRNAFIHAKDLVKELNKALEHNLDVYLMGKIVNVNGYNNITIEHSSMIKIKKEK
jgi:hypothetical protein